MQYVVYERGHCTQWGYMPTSEITSFDTLEEAKDYILEILKDFPESEGKTYIKARKNICRLHSCD